MADRNFTNVANGALLGAHFRRYMSPIAEKIAEQTNAKETATTFFDSAQEEKEALAWLPLFYEVRAKGLTIHLKRLIESRGYKNVLEVGVGVDAERALEVSENREINYICSDNS